MKNLHKPVMLKEVISYIPPQKSINIIDATFGGGGYSRAILKNFNVSELLAIDRDPISKILSKDILLKFKNFSLVNDKFSNIDKIVKDSKLKNKKFDVILYDLGTSSNQIDISKRGFSFSKEGPLNMQMGQDTRNAFEIVNKYDEKNLAKIIFDYGEERYSRIIAKEIVKNRKIKFIETTTELSDIIKQSIPKKIYLKKIFTLQLKLFKL